MKKIVLFMISSLVMTSCMKNNFDEVTYDMTQKQKFEKAFEKTFGNPSSDQDWGFDGTEILDLTSFIKAGTRGTTRSHNVNRNEWSGKFDVPANVTANERELVIAEFSKKRVGAVNTENINLTDYFIYEVYKGEDVYKDGFNNDVKGSDHMNHLQVKYAEGTLTPPNNACWEHANDFNNGASTGNWNTIEGATLMLNSGTLDFAYHNSTDSKYHSEYIIIPGEKIDASLAGYYYVGFDFYATHPTGQESNKNMDVERNWVFNDWIVRISPATFKNTRRIIAEDLGTDEDSDFDYNDVVFDAALTNENNKLVAHITLRAAGGTMPLYVAGKEVHQLFGVDTGVMVNTNNGTVNKPAVQFTAIIGETDWNNAKSIKDIPVKVITNKGEITLESNKGAASEKLCVLVGYKWCNERQPIQNKYPDFTRYVTDRNVEWYKVY